MKRIFVNDTTQEEATVSIETDVDSNEPVAVTVTRKTIGSKSKGKPIRIPLKRCRGESVEQEARVQEVTLQAQGFQFRRDDGEASSAADGPFVYIRVPAEKAEEVVEWMTGCQLPNGVSVHRVSQDTTLLRDAQNGEICASLTRSEDRVVTSTSPLAAVAYLLGERGLATIFAEHTFAPNKTEMLTPAVRAGLIGRLPVDCQDYLTEAGLQTVGVVKAAAITAAVML